MNTFNHVQYIIKTYHGGVKHLSEQFGRVIESG